MVRLWVAVRASLRSVLDEVSIADLAKGTLPKKVAKLLDDARGVGQALTRAG